MTTPEERESRLYIALFARSYNSYAGTCSYCAGLVRAYRGLLYRGDARWQVSHLACFAKHIGDSE